MRKAFRRVANAMPRDSHDSNSSVLPGQLQGLIDRTFCMMDFDGKRAGVPRRAVEFAMAVVKGARTALTRAGVIAQVTGNSTGTVMERIPWFVQPNHVRVLLAEHDLLADFQ